jgi:hypothetical protein
MPRVSIGYKEQDSINHPMMVPAVLLFPRGGLEVLVLARAVSETLRRDELRARREI